MTDRHRLMIAAFTGGFALSAGACIKASKADSKPADKAAGKTPGLPSGGAPAPAQRIHGCTTRFAIGPAHGPNDSCVLQPGTASPWKILPVNPEGGNVAEPWRAIPPPVAETSAKNRTAALAKAGTKIPEKPVTQETGARPFCVYEWDGPKGAVPGPKEFLALGEGTEPECGLSAAMATGSVPTERLRSLFEAFDRQARGLAETSSAAIRRALPKLGEAAPHPPTVAVVDATPFGLKGPDTSGHGFAVSRVIGSLACADVNSAGCDAMIKPYLALSLVRDPRTNAWVSNPNGGFIGYFHDLFRVFNRVLHDWNAPTRKKTEHLIINLSLGWDPIKTDPDSYEVARMTELLDRAYCEDVLVIAAAGNQTGSEGAVYPAALESHRPRGAAWCKEQGLPVPRSRAVYRPLIHAVGAVDEFDERMSVSRPWGQSRLAAYAMQVVTSAGAGAEAGYTKPQTGTSMSAAIDSGIAAAVWSARPDLDAASVMALIYEKGERIDQPPGHDRNRTEFCLADPKRPCEAWPVRRASLCRALNGAMPKAALPCRPPAKIPNAAVLPAIPPEVPPSGHPAEPVAPCRIAACGALVGPMDVQFPDAVLPQPGVASCPTCELTMGSVLGHSLGTVHGTWDTTPTGITSVNLKTSLGGWFGISSPQAGSPYSKSVWTARPANASVEWTYYDGANKTATTPLNVD